MSKPMEWLERGQAGYVFRVGEGLVLDETDALDYCVSVEHQSVTGDRKFIGQVSRCETSELDALVGIVRDWLAAEDHRSGFPWVLYEGDYGPELASSEEVL